MRIREHGDPPCGYLRRKLRSGIVLRPLIAMPSVRFARRLGQRNHWDITALKGPREGGAASTPTAASTSTLPTLPLRRPRTGRRSQAACERVGGGLRSH
jgi:hypothetical protein